MESVFLYINNAGDVAAPLAERVKLVRKLITFVDGVRPDDEAILTLVEEQLDNIAVALVKIANTLDDANACAVDICDHSTPKRAVIRRARSRRGSLGDAMSETP